MQEHDTNDAPITNEQSDGDGDLLDELTDENNAGKGSQGGGRKKVILWTVVGLFTVIALVVYVSIGRSTVDTDNPVGDEFLTCEERGGRSSAQCGLTDCFEVCDFDFIIYDDAGESCMTSDDCQGRCLLVDEFGYHAKEDHALLTSLFCFRTSAMEFGREIVRYQCQPPEPIKGQCEKFDSLDHCEYALELSEENTLEPIVDECTLS